MILLSCTSSEPWIGSQRLTIPNLARPVRDAIADLGLGCFVAPIDPSQADTAAFCAAYEAAEVSANCAVVAGRRADDVHDGSVPGAGY